METQSVDVVLSTPGIYVLVGNHCTLGFCEVDKDGTCHQLRPQDFARDGELRRGGWRKGVVFYGPLARAAS
jgi:hypothetical protein